MKTLIAISLVSAVAWAFQEKSAFEGNDEIIELRGGGRGGSSGRRGGSSGGSGSGEELTAPEFFSFVCMIFFCCAMSALCRRAEKQ